jgi:hypothetical protein
MPSSIINQSSYGLSINLTFYFNHVGLIICLSIVQGCIVPWHASTHVPYFLLFLNVMHSPHLISLVRTIFIHVISFTSLTLYGLFSWPISQGIYHFFITLRWFPLLMCLRTITNERWLKSFLPLIHISFHLVIPGLLESWPSSVLLIQILILSYGFF